MPASTSDTESRVESIAFVSSAFNEEGNLQELYKRSKATAEIVGEIAKGGKIGFCFVVADNHSTDKSEVILRDLARRDSRIVGILNQRNYGAEPSAMNALRIACNNDYVVLLCSDLQDPPELCIEMMEVLLNSPEIDAVLGIKTRSSGNRALRTARKIYYRILGYTSRLQTVPQGFHGFGCYRRKVIEDAIMYWEHTDLSLRQCLVNATVSPAYVGYVQEERICGKSSYGKFGYWLEALRSLASSDAASSRLALSIGASGLVIAALLSILICLNLMTGVSGYSGGVPTVMALVLFSLAVQMLMFSLISRQIESIRSGGFRANVRFTMLEDSR